MTAMGSFPEWRVSGSEPAIAAISCLSGALSAADPTSVVPIQVDVSLCRNRAIASASETLNFGTV